MKINVNDNDLSSIGRFINKCEEEFDEWFENESADLDDEDEIDELRDRIQTKLGEDYDNFIDELFEERFNQLPESDRDEAWDELRDFLRKKDLAI